MQTQSAGTVEYTDCISAERYDSLNECPRYDIKQSDVEAPVMMQFRVMPNCSSLP